MNLRGNANTWVLVILGGLVTVTAVDLGRRYFAPPASEATAATQKPEKLREYVPEFEVGDPAPDFTLADSKGKKHTLSQLVKKDTLLCFLCGCGNCRQIQAYMGTMLRRMKERAPQVIGVTTQNVEYEEAYLEQTKLPQTLLYMDKPAAEIKAYKGHPCPRVFRLKPDRTVEWIGPSIRELGMETGTEEMTQQVGLQLGFDRREVATLVNFPMATMMKQGRPKVAATKSLIPEASETEAPYAPSRATATAAKQAGVATSLEKQPQAAPVQPSPPVTPNHDHDHSDPNHRH